MNAPEKLQDILDYQGTHGNEPFLEFSDPQETLALCVKNSLVSDMMVPSGVEFQVGLTIGKGSDWIEHKFIFKISKCCESSDYLGSALCALGKILKRVHWKFDSFGIQDIIVTEPDNYYIILYATEDLRGKETD